jgi:hypothetical protein
MINSLFVRKTVGFAAAAVGEMFKVPQKTINDVMRCARNRFFLSCEGNIESALTIVPVMLLFLSVLQLGTISLSRVVFTGVSDEVATQQSFQSFDSSHDENSTAVPLPSQGELIIERNAHQIPSITPLLPQGDSFSTTGMSAQ